MTARLSALFELARFASVGVIATLVHLTAAFLILRFFHAEELVANLLAFCCAFPVSLFGHRIFTFGKPFSGRAFLLVALMGFALNNGALAALIAFTGIAGFPAIVISTLFVPAVTYLLTKLLIHHHHRGASQ